jgi:hypothetical protein
VKKSKKEYPAKVGKKTVGPMDFEEIEAEKFELIKREIGLNQDKEAIKFLIIEKCN